MKTEVDADGWKKIDADSEKMELSTCRKTREIQTKQTLRKQIGHPRTLSFIE